MIFALSGSFTGMGAQVINRADPPDASLHCSLHRFMQRASLPSGIDTLVLADSLEPPLTRVGRPIPRYPVTQLEAGNEGWVVVGMVVSPAGRVVVAEAMASSHPDFEAPALTSVNASEYEKPRIADRSVWVFACQTITFQLEARDRRLSNTPMHLAGVAAAKEALICAPAEVAIR